MSKAVVGVQVAQADRVHLAEPAVPLERAERAAAQVNDQAEPVGLDQVAGRGAAWAG